MARELVLVAVFLAVYEEIRWHMVQAGGAAASHALSVVSAERALGLFHERAVQAMFTPWDSVTDVFNTYYGGTHFLVPAAILAWLLLRHPERYARARTARQDPASIPAASGKPSMPVNASRSPKTQIQ